MNTERTSSHQQGNLLSLNTRCGQWKRPWRFYTSKMTPRESTILKKWKLWKLPLPITCSPLFRISTRSTECYNHFRIRNDQRKQLLKMPVRRRKASMCNIHFKEERRRHWLDEVNFNIFYSNWLSRWILWNLLILG